MGTVVRIPFEVTEPEPLPLGEQRGGVVLPGTATGKLTGLRGAMTIAQDEAGAVLTLDYDLP